MGLDAFVFCNCFEVGKLKEPLPHPELVYVKENGGLDCMSDDSDVLDEFDTWLEDRACEHEGVVLGGHYIGNAWFVNQLWNELEREQSKFPVLLNKVLYSGTHTGDFMEREDILNLKEELVRLTELKCDDPETQSWINEFHEQMSELVEAALSVNKPIAF